MSLIARVQVLLVLLALPAALAAQMTIEGEVRDASGGAVAAASVSIPALRLTTRTGTDGRYNFIIPAAQVRGQAVVVTARHGRFGTQSRELRITGGAARLDFALSRGPSGGEPRPGGAPGREPPRDSVMARADSAGTVAVVPWTDAMDLAQALQGRIAGLNVIGASSLGGSSPMFFRGPRSFENATQPLVVVDGVVVDNQPFSSALQRFGLGGFDYGAAAQELPLEDVERIVLLDPATAALRYGSRAANGVVEVTTKGGAGVTGFLMEVSQRTSGEVAGRLPAYQNSYGQGLGGAFEFFDGAGGGINDAVPESWGPRLDGRPLAQHSFTEPGRADVRFWLPHPDGVRDYFGDGRTVDAGVALLGSRAVGGRTSSLRASASVRDARGLTPGAAMRRLGLTVTGGVQPWERLRARAALRMVGTAYDGRPGTGFDEVNPVAGFTRMGRQVDLDSLRAAVTDADGNQINWIYTARNNPFFATARNDNRDERRLLTGALDLEYDLPRGFRAEMRAGGADVDHTRRVSVAPGWKGGFPSTLGRGDFGAGGADEQSVRSGEQTVDLRLALPRMRAAGLDAEVLTGLEARRSTFDLTTLVTDRPAVGAPSITTDERDGDASVIAYHVQSRFNGAGALSGLAGLRLEQSSEPANAAAALYPALSVSYDAARGWTALTRSIGLARLDLRASWWRSGNEVTTRALSQVYASGESAGIADGSASGAERTEGIQVGAVAGTGGDRLRIGVATYRERSTDLLFASGAGIGQTARLLNSGYELSLLARPLASESGIWEVGATWSKNTNEVDALGGGALSAPLSPSIFGAVSTADVGRAAGTIRGTRYLRDASGRLLLGNGLPLVDSTDTFAILGSWQPDWLASIQSRYRRGIAEVRLLVDARIGGQIFSATNLWGSYSGTLESTLAGREDSLVIAGLDSASGAPNTTKVSAEDYFHALGAIHEAWVYDASYVKLREARIGIDMPSRFLPGFREHDLRVAIFGRNLLTWSRAPNIDAETSLSAGVFQGFEMGQLPTARSVGIMLTVAP